MFLLYINSTMDKAITRKRNIERKNFAPPLSALDPRVNRPRGRGNAGKNWFNMPMGKLTPQNKLHFLMVKYRHLIYRKYKPARSKGDYIPQYFQMGTYIEGPQEFYSDRIPKKQRKNSWAKQYLSDPSTKAWLEEKTRRAKDSIRNPKNVHFVPLRKLHHSNQDKLKKKIEQNRSDRDGFKRSLYRHKKTKW